MRRFALALCATVLVAGCGGSAAPSSPADSGTPKKGGKVTVALESELRVLDPAESSLLVEREVFYNVYDSLFTIDTGLKIQPGLVTKWDTSDPLNFVFTLRPNVKFHDGTPFDSSIVKYNIERAKTMATSKRKSELASVKSVEMRDKLTAVFHLAKSDATLLATLVDRSGMMVSPAAVEKAGKDFSVNPVNAGTGPFAFVEWKRNDHLTLRKNEGYWQSGLPYLDTVTYRAIPDVNAILSALKTGDVDIARQIASKDVASLKTDGGFIYKQVPSLGFNGFELNTSAPPFNDPAKRKAVALAIDKRSILKNIFFNIGVLGYGPVPPPSWAFDPNEKVFDAADPEKAKATATGFSFTYKTTADPVVQQLAQLMQGQLAKAGITMTVQTEEFAVLVQEAQAHKFQAAQITWSGRVDPDGNMYSWFHTGGDNNDTAFSNSEVDRLLEDARTSLDQAKRKANYQQAQKLIAQDAPYIFTHFGVSTQITSSKIRHFTIYPDGMIRLAEVGKA